MKFIRIFFISVIIILTSINLSVFLYQAYYKYVFKSDLIDRLNENNTILYARGNLQKLFLLPNINKTNFFQDNESFFSTIVKIDEIFIGDKELAIFLNKNNQVKIIMFVPTQINTKQDFFYIQNTPHGSFLALDQKTIEDFLQIQNSSNYLSRKELIKYNKNDIVIFINYKNLFRQLMYDIDFSAYNIQFYPGIFWPILSKFNSSIFSINFYDDNLNIKIYHDFNIKKTQSQKFDINSRNDWIKYISDTDDIVFKSNDLLSTINTIKNLSTNKINIIDLENIDNLLFKKYELHLDDIGNIFKNDYMFIQNNTGNIALFTNAFNKDSIEYTNIKEKFKKNLPLMYPNIEKIILNDGKKVDALVVDVENIKEISETYSGFNITYFSILNTPVFIEKDKEIIFVSDKKFAYNLIDRYITNNVNNFPLDINYNNFCIININNLSDENLWVFGQYFSLIQDMKLLFNKFMYGNILSTSEVYSEIKLVYKK